MQTNVRNLFLFKVRLYLLRSDSIIILIKTVYSAYHTPKHRITIKQNIIQPLVQDSTIHMYDGYTNFRMVYFSQLL